MFLMLEFLDISSRNPSSSFMDNLRVFNIALGVIACLSLYMFGARKRWKFWNVPTRLGWMSLFMLCFAGTYGTFETRYLDTYFRVPMITAALGWAIVSALWPSDRTEFWPRKK